MNEQLKVIITAEIANIKKNVEAAKKKVADFAAQVEKAKADVDADFAAIGNAAKTAFAAVGVAAVGAAAALIGLAGSTEESRENQIKLATAFEAAGMSADEAASTYTNLYSILGDDGQAVEAAAHIAKLTSNEEDLSTWTDICAGVYAQFGDSLPIESLTEAANETAKTGKLTGGLADALNWAGINEEEFQAKLDACNTEAEREALIRETLIGVYGDSADAYKENNKQLIKQREAQAKLQSTLNRLGAAVAPVITMFLEFANKALSAVAPYIEQIAEKYLPKLEELLYSVADGLAAAYNWASQHQTLLAVLAGIIGGIVAAIGLYNTVAAVKAAMAAAEVASVWGLVSAYAAHAVAVMTALAPYLLIVAAIAAVIAIVVLCVKHWDTIKAAIISAAQSVWEFLQPAFESIMTFLQPVIDWLKMAWEEIVIMFGLAWEAIKAVWDFVAPYFQAIWDWISSIFGVVVAVLGGYFSAAWEAIKGVWSIVVDWFSTVWDNIKIVFSAVKEILGSYFLMAWENIKIIWGGVVDWFSTLWENIKLIFSVVKDVFSGNFRGAWESIKQIFANFGDYFSRQWNRVKQIFGNVGSFFKSAFNTAWTAIKSVFSNVSDFFQRTWNRIKQIFSNVGTAISNAINNTVKTAINKVLSAAVKIINGFIGAINVAIGVINAIPGVSISKLSKLDVPELAKGGIVDSATLAVVGEQGKEAIVPLENNLEWLDKLADKITAKQGGNTPIVLTVDGKVFAQTSIDSINALTRQSGNLGLVIV